MEHRVVPNPSQIHYQWHALAIIHTTILFRITLTPPTSWTHPSVENIKDYLSSDCFCVVFMPWWRLEYTSWNVGKFALLLFSMLVYGLLNDYASREYTFKIIIMNVNFVGQKFCGYTQPFVLLKQFTDLNHTDQGKPESNSESNRFYQNICRLKIFQLQLNPK